MDLITLLIPVRYRCGHAGEWDDPFAEELPSEPITTGRLCPDCQDTAAWVRDRTELLEELVLLFEHARREYEHPHCINCERLWGERMQHYARKATRLRDAAESEIASVIGQEQARELAALLAGS